MLDLCGGWASSVTIRGLQAKEGQPSWWELGPGAQQPEKAAWAGAWVPGGGRAGQACSQEHGDSRQDGHRRQNKPKAAREEPGCERGHPPNPGGSASRPRMPGTDPQRHSSDPQGGQPTAPAPLPEVAGPQETGAAWAGSASVTDGANCLLQRGDPGAQRGASEQVSQAGGGPAHPEPY